MNPDAVARAGRIRLMVFDVDGVMTDGRLYLSDSGEEIKAFHTRDGQGIKLLQESGVEIALLTARKSQLVARRAAELGIRHVVQGAEDKLAGFIELLAACQVEPRLTGYMGDDLVDLPVLRRCGLAVSVPDAPEVVRSHVHHVTRLAGGHGAVRELCEFVMMTQGTLDNALAPYLNY